MEQIVELLGDLARDLQPFKNVSGTDGVIQSIEDVKYRLQAKLLAQVALKRVVGEWPPEELPF